MWSKALDVVLFHIGRSCGVLGWACVSAFACVKMCQDVTRYAKLVRNTDQPYQVNCLFSDTLLAELSQAMRSAQALCINAAFLYSLCFHAPLSVQDLLHILVSKNVSKNMWQWSALLRLRSILHAVVLEPGKFLMPGRWHESLSPVCFTLWFWMTLGQYWTILCLLTFVDSGFARFAWPSCPQMVPAASAAEASWNDNKECPAKCPETLGAAVSPKLEGDDLVMTKANKKIPNIPLYCCAWNGRKSRNWFMVCLLTSSNWSLRRLKPGRAHKTNFATHTLLGNGLWHVWEMSLSSPYSFLGIRPGCRNVIWCMTYEPETAWVEQLGNSVLQQVHG